MSYQTLYNCFPTTILIDPPGTNDELSPPILQTIEQCWDKQQQRCQGLLFNGWLFSVTECQADSLRGRFVPYSWYVAWRHHPSLRVSLPLWPLGVSGIAQGGGLTLIGRRSTTVNYYAEAYEFVPSGAIDMACLTADGSGLDFIGLLQRELFEEVGIDSSAIESITPLALIHDEQNHVIQACAILHIPSSVLHTARPNPHEYSELRLLSHPEMTDFLTQQTNVVPLTRYLWQQWL